MDKKGIIALVLCAIILIIYFPYILPMISPPAPKIDEREENDKEDKSLEQLGLEQTTQDNSPASISPSFKETVSSEETSMIGADYISLQDNIVLQNENIVSVWTNDGAAIKSVTLKKYKDSSRTREMEIIKPLTNDYLPMSIPSVKVSTNNKSEDIKLSERRFEVINNSKDKAMFTTSLEGGVQLFKNIEFSPDKYHMTMDIVFKNNSDQNVACEYELIAASGIDYEGDPHTDITTVVGINKGNGGYKLLKTNLKNLPESNESVGISWVGSVNKYFAAILKPESSDWIRSAMFQPIRVNEGVTEDFLAGVKTKAFTIPPRESVTHKYVVFLGPKLSKVMLEYNLESLLGFGTFKVISTILLKVLNGFYNLIPNYGIAVLFLTFIVKLMLFPLTRKSQTSMFKMQDLQPKIEELKKKYKNDKQRMAKAQMELFKSHGANPLGGCLPMVLQLPVFFALFRTLQLSFEMRQAPFAFWISDLSMPDTLITLPFTLPVIGNMLNILPFIMTVASFVQMKLNPKTPTADPQAKMQQKMMSFMPLMFCFILYKMPSGLTLYWTTSTLFSIGENLFIRKSLKKIKKSMPVIRN